MKTILTTGCMIAACMSTASAQTLQDYSGSYLCKLTASAGLRLDQQSQTWNGVIFNVAQQSILMKIEVTGQTGSSTIHAEFGRYRISFKDFGSKDAPLQCVSNYAASKFVREVPVIDGRIDCRAFSSHYQVNLPDRKIQIMFDGGYMDDWKENQDTPYVAVGVCEKVS